MVTVGISFQNPTKYVGPDMNIVPIKEFGREPLPTDKKFLVGMLALIGKDPPTGNEGDLWYLSSFNSSGDAVWKQINITVPIAGIQSILTDEGGSPVVPNGSGVVNILGGTGCSTSGQDPSTTVTINVSGLGLDWDTITSSTETIAINTGYFANAGGGVTFTLPTVAPVGSIFAVTNINAGGFTIAQNASQTLRIGDQVTTTGVAGSVAASDLGTSVLFVCNVANTSFIHLGGPQGELTIT